MGSLVKNVEPMFIKRHGEEHHLPYYLFYVKSVFSSKWPIKMTIEIGAKFLVINM